MMILLCSMKFIIVLILSRFNQKDCCLWLWYKTIKGRREKV